MTCAELAELLTAYLDGALDERSETALVVHLDGCPACRTLLEQYRQTVRALGPTAPSPAGPSTAAPSTALPGLPPAQRAALLAAFREACR